MKIETFADVISLWPDLHEFSRDVGVSYELARKWRHRGSIPARYWSRIIQKGAMRGYPLSPGLLTELAAAAA